MCCNAVLYPLKLWHRCMNFIVLRTLHYMHYRIYMQYNVLQYSNNAFKSITITFYFEAWLPSPLHQHVSHLLKWCKADYKVSYGSLYWWFMCFMFWKMSNVRWPNIHVRLSWSEQEVTLKLYDSELGKNEDCFSFRIESCWWLAIQKKW